MSNTNILYNSKNLDEFNSEFLLAHKIFGRTPIPDFFNSQGIWFHNMPDEFNNEEELIAFKSTMGKSPDQQILNDLIFTTADKVRIVKEYNSTHNIYLKINEFKNKLCEEFSLTQVGEHLTGKIGGHQVIISYRDKSLASIVHKMNIGVDNETGKGVGKLNIEDILDILGFTIEVLSHDFYDSLDVMYEVEKFMYSNGAERKRIRTKTPDFQEKLKHPRVENNPGLIDSLDGVNYYKKASSAEGYLEVIRPNYLWNHLPIEFKYTLDSSNNQYGLNFTGLYEYWEKYLKGYAGHWLQKNSGLLVPIKSQITIASNHFVTHLDQIIKGNPDKRGTPIQSYKKELHTDLIKNGYIPLGPQNIDKSIETGVNKYFTNKSENLKKVA